MNNVLVPAGLELETAAALVVARPMQRFPQLITDVCLADASSELAAATRASFSRGGAVVYETLTMPRAGFGPRPVSVLSPEARTLYVALAGRLSSSLPEPTRGMGKWSEHRAFGLQGEHDHIVELDIAAFYEYINHRVLADELLLRSMDAAGVEALERLLAGLAPRGYGIPQMMQVSDRLADAYLSIMDRRLARSGLEAHRFADDIRVLARDWESANRIVEAAAGIARNLGLVLSSEKTSIYRRSTLVDAEGRDQTFFDDYFKRVHADMVEADFLADGPYADEREDEAADQEFDDRVYQETALRILEEYLEAAKDNLTEDGVDLSLRRFVRTSVAVLQSAPDRLSDDHLERLVFYDPRRLEEVARYLKARAANKDFGREPHWESAARFAALGRQSPWAKLWLLDLAESLPAPPKRSESAYTSFVDWGKKQVGDQHEAVRAEAAWFLSGLDRLDQRTIESLYASSTSLSRPALGAIVGVNSTLPKWLVAAIRDESPLSRAAFKWASK